MSEELPREKIPTAVRIKTSLPRGHGFAWAVASDEAPAFAAARRTSFTPNYTSRMLTRPGIAAIQKTPRIFPANSRRKQDGAQRPGNGAGGIHRLPQTESRTAMRGVYGVRNQRIAGRAAKSFRRAVREANPEDLLP